jgi:hypothetical protein
VTASSWPTITATAAVIAVEHVPMVSDQFWLWKHAWMNLPPISLVHREAHLPLLGNVHETLFRLFHCASRRTARHCTCNTLLKPRRLFHCVSGSATKRYTSQHSFEKAVDSREHARGSSVHIPARPKLCYHARTFVLGTCVLVYLCSYACNYVAVCKYVSV